MFYESKRCRIVQQTRKRIEEEQQSAELKRQKRFAQRQQRPVMRGEVFEFETVTVNAKGEIVEKKYHQADAKTEELGNGVTLEMVYVPGGTFMMGSPDTEKHESPLHQVTVQPFYMSKYPITQAQCQAVIGVNPSYSKGENRPGKRALTL